MNTSKLGLSTMAGVALLTALAGITAGPAARAAPAASAGADANLERLGDRVVGLVAPEQAVRFGLQLPFHDQAGLDVLDQRLYTPGDPLFHQFLSAQQFNAPEV